MLTREEMQAAVLAALNSVIEEVRLRDELTEEMLEIAVSPLSALAQLQAGKPRTAMGDDTAVFDESAVLSIVSSLEEKGLVVRVASPLDADTSEFVLTDRGKRLLDSARVQQRAGIVATIAGMPDATLLELIPALQTLAAKLAAGRSDKA